ncbi:putative ERG24-C-14 sterol reductase [Meira miltonrushii]|uniref:Delta(14)-sterol reductase ERG24 n=1 Tax=Meira miltonrushii TaxID=1280837 RepID=A0A316V5H7_9BASI|nr:putative ERG24-C-14 sterol reductase [Meira miltonrushii]PWN32829.1 putative ERG24-C-14 sterol reductase [Meira miltonrushii]
MVQTRGQSTPSRSRSRKKSTSSLKSAAAQADTPNGSATKAAIENTTSNPDTPTPKPRGRKSTKKVADDSASNASTTSTPAKKTVQRKTSTRSIKKKDTMLNPKTTEYEFGGPVGAAGVSILTPFFAYLLYFACNEKVGCSILPRYPEVIAHQFVAGVKESFLDWQAWAVYFGWYAFCIVAWAVLPGQQVQGTELRTGKKLEYKINAFATFLAAAISSAVIIFTQGAKAFDDLLYGHWPGLITASITMAVVQSIYVYVESFKADKLLAKGGNTGNHLFDWFIGRELNPRIGVFDIKTFNELRPGMILWYLLDISCACHQFVSLNGRITDSMALVVLFHTWYIVDALFNESSILTQMDITTDGFGFMLSVGDLTWVPFVYGLQARYLAFHPKDLGILATVAILALNFTGYYIFRTANGEKNDFRNGSNKKNLQFMTTSSGRKLLTSGWWGRSRHPNYFGDWIMAFSWSLPTGFETPITYFYFAFFVVLLVHRQLRDDAACQHKYGKDWTKYTKLVPSRIIPYVY